MFWQALGVGGLFIAAWAVLGGHFPWRAAATSALWGWGGLLAVHLLGSGGMQLLPIAPVTVGAAGALGLPGVIGMLLLKLVWGL